MIMKKLLLIALLPLAVGCSKSTDVQPIGSSTVNTPKAKQAANVTFTSAGVHVGNEVYDGTFSASGLISGTGTTQEAVAITIPLGGSVQALMNATYTFHSTQTFTFAASSGSITVVTSGTWAFTDPSLSYATGTGNWNIISSTGAYAGLQGNGTLSISIDFTGAATSVTDSYTGYVHF
jgi:hypothetical protein